MIEGINIRCNVGRIEVLRSPRIVLSLRRRSVVSTCEIDIPDADGSVQTGLAQKQAVRVRFGHRGEGGTWHDWQGTIKDFAPAGADTIRVFTVGQEQALIDTTVLGAMHGEPSDVVARRLLAATGLPVAEITIPVETFPHIVFSNVTVARALKQLSSSLERSWGHDLSKHAVWLGEAGLYWSDGNEPGDVFVIEAAANMITNNPNPAGMSYAISTVLPGLTHSRMVRIRDPRRDYSELVRAEEVIHILGVDGNTTTIGYGANQGWG
ncbi:MAG TPA: hypothetical protein H9894_10290 [Candidatus Desulfovibrio intestinipullorum]|uniref:Uncharacterized protein n=1 Tax=Candidatus Desulfovibrio intestinipullorum TaxID=2838536 RepID=A0A9D1PYT3_9BACT|nr:hypothetical protein [Candidatus Desulfovibrio intestinipullorum]